MTGARRLPPGFFDDALREANVCRLHILQCFDEYVVSCAFVYLNPMCRPLVHHINAPSVPLPRSGAVPSHMGQLNPPPNPNPDLSAGPKIYLVYYTDGIDQTFSCKRSRSLAQPASLCVFFSFTVLLYR
jgi:hypothetical protein